MAREEVQNGIDFRGRCDYLLLAVRIQRYDTSMSGGGGRAGTNDHTVAADSTDKAASIWCIVANVVGEHPFGDYGEQTRVGLRKLRAHSKVYVLGRVGGDGEAVAVVGRLRYNNRYITIKVACKYLRNHRVRRVYSPHVIREAARHYPADPCDWSSEEGRSHMETLADAIVVHAGYTRVKIKEGPQAGERRMFPSSEIPEVLTETDANGTETSFRLRQSPTGRSWWYFLDLEP